MFKIISSFIIPHIGAIKIALFAALIIAVLGVALYINNLKSTIADRDKTIKENAVELGKWQQSNADLETLTTKQNKSIEALTASAQEAQQRASEALKKAKPIVEARQAIKQASQYASNSTPIELNTCEAAIERQKAILAGSLL
jgi:predicted PurR-regulated permease PerM